jgi:DNA polymerase III subunit beta
VKFRCERDILADALTTAGRAATAVPIGSLPVLSGVRLDLRGDVLTVTATDIELTISTDIEVAGQQDGSSVIPAKLDRRDCSEPSRWVGIAVGCR